MIIHPIKKYFSLPIYQILTQSPGLRIRLQAVEALFSPRRRWATDWQIHVIIMFLSPDRRAERHHAPSCFCAFPFFLPWNKGRVHFSASFSLAILPPTTKPSNHHHYPNYLSAPHTQSHLLQKVMGYKHPHRFAWKVWRKVDKAVQKVNASSTISCKWAAQQAEKDSLGQEVAGK